MIRPVSEIHVFEPHVPLKRDQGAVLLLPGPAACLFRAAYRFIPLEAYIHQIHRALIVFRLQIQHGEYPLRPGQRRQKETCSAG